MSKLFAAAFAIALIITFAGCGSQTYLTPFTPTQTSSATPPYQAPPTTTTTTTTPPPSSSNKSVIITYSGKQASQITSGIYPDSPAQGNVFEIVTFTITNSAYSSFSVGEFYFDIIVNSIKYNSSIYSYDLSNALPSVDIMKGGSLTGSLAFEIPIGSSSYTPYYDDPLSLYNIQWIAQ